MQFPQGVTAVYELPWGKLRVVCPGAQPYHEPIDEIPTANVEGFCYAMEACATVEQKRTLYLGMVKNGLITSATDLVDPDLKAFCDLLRSHDWTYAMSDDGRSYRAGKAHEDRITAMMAGHPERKALYDRMVAFAYRKGPQPVLPA